MARYAGATINQQFDQFVQDNFPNLYDEWLLGPCEYLDLDAWLEMENNNPLTIFQGLRGHAAAQARPLYEVIEEWEAARTAIEPTKGDER